MDRFMLFELRLSWLKVGKHLFDNMSILCSSGCVVGTTNRGNLIIPVQHFSTITQKSRISGFQYLSNVDGVTDGRPVLGSPCHFK